MTKSVGDNVSVPMATTRESADDMREEFEIADRCVKEF